MYFIYTGRDKTVSFRMTVYTCSCSQHELVVLESTLLGPTESSSMTLTGIPVQTCRPGRGLGVSDRNDKSPFIGYSPQEPLRKKSITGLQCLSFRVLAKSFQTKVG